MQFYGCVNRGHTQLHPGRWPCKAEGHVFKAACLGGCLLLASAIFARSKYDSFGGEAAVAALVAAARGGTGEGRGEKWYSFLSFNCDTKSDSRCLFSSSQFSLVNWKMEVEMMDNHR